MDAINTNASETVRSEPAVVAKHTVSKGRPQRVILVLQGGGALGAYQAGVYQAMEEAGLQPEWVIGTSIGAINASLIAGNAPGKRLERLRSFWRGVEHGFLPSMAAQIPIFGQQFANWLTIANGLQGFFTPNPLAFASPTWPLGSERAGYYRTDPLKRSLTDHVDFDLINTGSCRLTVGAANVRTAKMHYFDSRDMTFDVRHVMASGALPPAFPPVLINDELYWDGGILSNTPVEAVFDDHPRRNSLVFAVHIWNPDGGEPDTLWKVLSRQKDLQYASRAKTHIMRQQQLHRLRHIISELSKRLPEEEKRNNLVREMMCYGCPTRMHVVRLLAPPFAGEDHSKDIDFSARTIRTRWQAGYEETLRVLARRPWEAEFDPLEGVLLHESQGGELMAAE